jgi:hypothetical protein
VSLPLTELTSGLYRGTVVDEFGNLVKAVQLTTLTLTLYDRASGGIINSRDAQNVLAASGVTVAGVTMFDTLQTDPDGVTYNLRWDLAPEDNPILTDALATETHVALFQATWTGGRCNHTVNLPVRNLAKVTA